MSCDRCCEKCDKNHLCMGAGWYDLRCTKNRGQCGINKLHCSDCKEGVKQDDESKSE